MWECLAEHPCRRIQTWDHLNGKCGQTIRHSLGIGVPPIFCIFKKLQKHAYRGVIDAAAHESELRLVLPIINPGKCAYFYQDRLVLSALVDYPLHTLGMFPIF
jgi:hypothetical protein